MTKARSGWIGRRVLRGPVATLALGALAVVVALWPGLAEAAQLDRALVAAEPWRIFTGHLSHFSFSHLAYDAAVLLGLGCVCESRWPALTRAALVVAPLACSAVVLLGAPELSTYRGLSGLGSTLLVLLAARLHVERAFRSAWMRHLPLLTVLGFLAKTAYELWTDAAIFVDEAALFVPVPLVHVTGGLIGLLAGVWLRSGRAGYRSTCRHGRHSVDEPRILSLRLPRLRDWHTKGAGVS